MSVFAFHFSLVLFDSGFRFGKESSGFWLHLSQKPFRCSLATWIRWRHFHMPCPLLVSRPSLPLSTERPAECVPYSVCSRSVFCTFTRTRIHSRVPREALRCKGLQEPRRCGAAAALRGALASFGHRPLRWTHSHRPPDGRGRTTCSAADGGVFEWRNATPERTRKLFMMTFQAHPSLSLRRDQCFVKTKFV